MQYKMQGDKSELLFGGEIQGDNKTSSFFFIYFRLHTLWVRSTTNAHAHIYPYHTHTRIHIGTYEHSLTQNIRI